MIIPLLILSFIADFINFITLVLCGKYFKRLSTPSYNIILHTLLMFIANISTTLLSWSRLFSTAVTLHILTILGFLIIVRFYAQIIPLSPKQEKILKILTLLILLFCLSESFVFSSILVPNIYSVTLTACVKIILTSIYLFKFVFNSHIQEDAYSKSDHILWAWFSGCILLYSASTLFFFLFVKWMTEQGIVVPFYYVNAAFYIITCSLICFATFKHVRNKTTVLS